MSEGNELNAPQVPADEELDSMCQCLIAQGNDNIADAITMLRRHKAAQFRIMSHLHERAERAEAERDALQKSILDLSHPNMKMLLEERDALRKALTAIVADPHGCRFCDSGKLRNPNKPHDDTCGFALAAAIDAAKGKA